MKYTNLCSLMLRSDIFQAVTSNIEGLGEGDGVIDKMGEGDGEGVG